MDNTYEKDNKNKSEKNRSYITGLLVIILLFICCIPAFREIKTEDEVIDIEEGEKFGLFEDTKSNNIEQAKENTKNYIKYKYGFNPTILDVKLEYQENGFKTGYATVEVKYKSEKFSVMVPSDRKSVNGIDNYQEKEIRDTIMKEIEREIGKPYSYEISYSFSIGNHYTSFEFIQDLYDGTNIIDIINNNNFNISLSYLEDVDFEKIDKLKTNPKSIFSSDIDIVMGKFKSKEAYNSIKLYNAHLEDDLLQFAMYLDEGFLNNNRDDEYGIDNKYYKFEMKEYDGIYFYTENINDLKIEKNNNIDWSNYTSLPRLTDDYILSGVEGKISIYCPVNKIKVEENAWIKMFCLNQDGNVVDELGHKHGEYYYFNIDLSKGTNRISILGD